MSFRFSIVLFFCFLGIQSLNAQLPITINVQILPPYSPFWENLLDLANNNRLLITLSNSSANAQNIYLHAIVVGDNGVSIKAKNGVKPNQAITIQAFETRPLSSQEVKQIYSLVSLDDLDYSGVNLQDVLLNHIIPEGTYQICGQAYDYNSEVPLSEDVPLGCSNYFGISYLETPEIISISNKNCDDIINPHTPQNLSVHWTIPSGAPTVDLIYTLQLVEMISPNQTPEEVLNNPGSSDLYEEEISPQTQTIITENKKLLLDGSKYAIRVNVKDKKGTHFFINIGIGTACSFNYGNESNGSGAMSLDSIYPPNNAWMPFNYFPISVRFSPYDDAIYECQANLSIETDAGGNLDDVTRPVLHWSKGPAKSQSDVMGRTIQEWESRHISVNRTPQDQNAPEYHRGVKYNWSTELGFRIRGKSNDESGTVSASFNYGMNVPKLNLPHNNITRDTGIIKFKFSTADAPSYNILPSYKIGQSNNSETPRYFNGTIYEKCVLQIAKSESFDSIYASQLWVIGQGLDLQTSSEQEVRDSLFKVVEYNFNFKDTGTYYYRVAWLSLPSESYSTDNLIYNSTLTRKFKIQTKTKVPEPPVEQGGGGCISNCQSLPQPLGADLQKDSVIKKLTIGKFEMKVDSLKWTSNRISGFGHILVPFLKNSYVKVKFENLLLNDSLAVKDGIVNAVTADWVPSKYAKKVSGEMDWDTTFTQTMDTYFQQGSNLLTGMILDIPMELPIGLDQMIMGRRYAIGIVGMEFTYEKAIFNAVMVMDFPHLGGTLSMGATNICFSPSGVDNKRMYLYSPVDKHYLDLNDADIWLSGDSNGDTSKCTFAKFDCGGLTALSVKGRMEFSKKILINDSPTGSPDSLKNVTGRFSGLLQKDGDKWNHIYSLDIDPFQIPGGEGWGMHLKKAWLDYSLVKNPDNIVFPKSYESYDIVHFKGIYIESLDIKFPRSMSFGQVSNDGRFTLSVNNFIVDKNGVSGNIEAKNLIPINSGILSKMAFSLDTLRIVLNRNKFEESALIGQLKLSISTTPLSYKATINNNAENHLDYLFLIKPAKDMNIPIWKSKMDLLETSQIKLGFTGKNDSLSFESNFNGSMSFDSDFPVVNQVDLKLIKFEGFKLSIRSPHIVWGHWSLASPAHSLGGFPVTIDSIYGANRMHDGHLQAGIGMKVSLKVGGETNNFKAGTAFNIYAQLSDPGSLTTAQAWEYGGIEFDSVGIEGNVGIVSIKGNLKFYDENPTYGHGMRGTLHVEFKPKIAIDAVAQFGHKEGLQYWYVDASAKFSPGIPLAPGAQITGFGGGAWYHMHLAGLPGPEDVVYGANSNVSAVGSSYSGGSFVPDGSKLFGFEARMDLSAEKKNIYYSKLAIGAEFTSSGGIDLMYLRGDLKIMKKAEDKALTPVYAKMDASYDFQNDIFSAQANVFVNAANGAVKGIGAQNSAGNIQIYIDANKWFIKVGEPTSRCGLKVLNTLEFNSYFMIGSQIPGVPDLPEPIKTYLNEGGGSQNKTRDPKVTNGSGFALGAQLIVKPDTYSWECFYIRLGFQIGADIALLDSKDLKCGSASSGEIGIDGWYANGQIYSYFDAACGLQWHGHSYEVLKLTAAAAFQGGGLNPFWLDGRIKFNYSILGGWHSGSANFHFEYGTKCIPPATNPFGDIDLVSSITPANGSTNVPVYVIPTVAFNIPPLKVFQVIEQSPNGSVLNKNFRVNFNYFNIKLGNAIIECNPYSKLKDQLYQIVPIALLPGDKSYKISITCQVEEQNSSGGSWTISKEKNGQNITKTYESNFKTGIMPDSVPYAVTDYAWPLFNQRYYLQDECKTNVLYTIQDVKDIVDLYSSISGQLINSQTKDTIEVKDVKYSGLSFKFKLPQMANKTMYCFRIVGVKKPTSNSPGFADTKKLEESNISVELFHNDDVSVKQTRYIIKNNLFKSDPTPVLYKWYFATSEYNLLSDKLKNMPLTPTYSASNSFEDIIYFNRDVTKEPFETYDLKPVGRLHYPKLVYAFSMLTSHFDVNYGKFYIYDLQKDLKAKGYNDFKFTYRSFDLDDAPMHALTLRSYSSSLTAMETEIAFPSLNGGNGINLGTGSVQTQSSIPVSPPNPIVITLETGWYAYLDFINNMGTISTLISNYNSSNSTTKTKFRNIISPANYTKLKYLNENGSTTYQGIWIQEHPVAKTNTSYNYRVNFQYQSPACCPAYESNCTTPNWNNSFRIH